MSFSENYEIIEGVDGGYTALDPATNISSYGDSKEEAFENLQENLEDYYSSKTNNDYPYWGLKEPEFMIVIVLVSIILWSFIISFIVHFGCAG